MPNYLSHYSGLRTDDVLAVDVRSNKLANQTGSYFYLKDALGSITDIANASGESIQSYQYSSFGKLLSIKDKDSNVITEDPILKTSFTYTNREYDEESGMYYYRARYYEPSIGRFLQEDPHPGKNSNPISFLSKYIYAHNNPIKFTDPTGKFAFLIGIALSGLVSGFYAKEAGGDFWQGFISGAISGATVAGGAFLGAFSLSFISGSGFLGAINAAVIGGSALTMLGGAIGGAVGAYYNAINHLKVKDPKMLFFASGMGALGGFGLGASGYGVGYGWKEFFSDKNNFLREVIPGLAIQGCVWGNTSLQDGGESVEDGYGGTCMGPTEVN